MPLIPATGDNFKKIVIQNTGSAVVADTISDTLTLIGGAGITITANEAGDSITLAAAATLNTAGLDDILNNGNTSTFGITVASATIDDTVINGNSITVTHASNNLTLSTTGTGTINIGKTLNVKDILPTADITYDLGSPSYRFRDLYLSGSSIKLGSATITSTGTAINLPAGTTVGGNSFIDDVIPSQTGQVDKYLRTNGSTLYWANLPDQLPNRTGNNGKFLFTDGSAVSWSLINDYIVGDIPYAVTFKNNVTIEGTLTTKQTVSIESTSVSVADKNIELGVTTTPTNVTADGGGITLKGATDKTITWVNSTGRWTSNQPFEASSFYGDVFGNVVGNVTGDVTGTVTNGVVTTGTYSDPSWITSLAGSKVTNAVLSTGSYNNPSWITGLTIAQGGTGAGSATEALTNLLPTGETSGYVLKTSGRGTYFWAAETGASTIVGTRIDSSRVTYTATSNQTVFTGVGTYTPGAGQLRVYVNGIRQNPDSYTETSGTSFTLSTGVAAGTTVLAEVDGYVSNTITANSVVSTTAGGLSSTNVQAALEELDSEKAPINSPSFTGTPSLPTGTTAVTQTAGDNSTKVATTAYVKTAIDNVVGAAPGALDTLNELATALGNDASFSTTVTSSIATKAPINSPTFTGTVSGISQSMISGNSGYTNIQVYSSGSGNWTVPAGVTRFKVTVIGGGGGGASSFMSTPAPGGGAGGGAIKIFNSVTPGTVCPYSVGAGGAAGAWLNPGSGGNGVASTFTYSTTTLTANGGTGGEAWKNSGSGSTNNYGGAPGGTSSGGDLNIPGGPSPSIGASTTDGGGGGGSAPFGLGFGGRGGQGNSGNLLIPQAGVGYGGGGGGGSAQGTQLQREGAAGSSGAIIIEY